MQCRAHQLQPGWQPVNVQESRALARSACTHYSRSTTACHHYAESTPYGTAPLPKLDITVQPLALSSCSKREVAAVAVLTTLSRCACPQEHVQSHLQEFRGPSTLSKQLFARARALGTLISSCCHRRHRCILQNPQWQPKSCLQSFKTPFFITCRLLRKDKVDAQHFRTLAALERLRLQHLQHLQQL